MNLNLNTQINFNDGPFVLEQQLISGLIANRQVAERWEKRKKEHEELRNNLKFFATKMKHRVFAPIGNKAMMKADLIHTNEITVSLGAGWFVKVSASDAMDICQRRIVECEETLKKCRAERQLLESRKDPKLRSEAFGGQEIIEEFDDKEEEKWKKEHREKVKQHKKQLAEVKEKISGGSTKTEEDLWKHLDMLELQEELEDELARLEDDNDGDDEEDEDEVISEDEDEDFVQEEKIIPDTTDKKRVTWAEGFGSEPITACSEPVPVKEDNKNTVLATAIKDNITETTPASSSNLAKPSRPASKFKKSRAGAE